MQFVKLRLSGFKSFVDPTQLHIEPGLTGIIGPNGCGKSNLVEALRWVMGESSARTVRGEVMEDVIFSGNATRPGRTLAEVCLTLDNKDRTAPAAFNDSDDIEVRRRIERNTGSSYRINGIEVRARDVQLLFADAATGARSISIVGQGRIAALLSGKPEARRTIIEEAAGITGLHARRHETELRLRGARTNLQRLEDSLTEMTSRLRDLQRQARQAGRYREIGEKIRHSEGRLLAYRWHQAEHARQESAQRLHAHEEQASHHQSEVTALAARQATAHADVTLLREQKATADAAWQRLTFERDRLTDEEARLATQNQTLTARLSQIEEDTAREAKQRDDISAVLDGLADEKQQLAAQDTGEDTTLSEKSLHQARERLDAMQAQIDRQATALAAQEAERNSLAQRITTNQHRQEKARHRLQHCQAAQDSDLLSEAENPQALKQKMETAQQGVDEVEALVRESDARLATAREALETARQSATITKTRLAEAEAEAKILRALFDRRKTTPLGGAMTIPAAYEAAIAVALGDGLNAPVEENTHAGDPRAEKHSDTEAQGDRTGEPTVTGWRMLPPLIDPPPLPEGIPALGDLINAPPALGRRLSLVGVCPTAADAHRLQDCLTPGQCLVTQEGGLWRWDGYRVAAQQSTQHLDQHRRLELLETHIADYRQQLDTEQKEVDKASGVLEQEKEADSLARTQLEAAGKDRDGARIAYTQAWEAALRQRTQIEEKRREVLNLERDIETLEAERHHLQSQYDAPSTIEETQQELAAQRAECDAERHKVMEAQRVYDDLARTINTRRERRATIEREQARWQARLKDCDGHMMRLRERRDEVQRDMDNLARKPDQLETEKQAINTRLSQAQAEQEKIGTTLSESEDKYATTSRELKERQQTLEQARTEEMRSRATHERCLSDLGHMEEKIGAYCHPDPVEPQLEAWKKDATLTGETLEKLEARLLRLTRERDNMGPVNLRAEQEAASVEETHNKLDQEREDLAAAITRLHTAITRLNREGRHRLSEAATAVNTHFGTLFSRLFGGGRAYIKLVEGEDPLEAGLEIYASPPGKKLSALTLLSGGEQTLTAIALLFAVFLTNPAPICILDEVDAPLDDANVARFCTLIEDIAARENTRFLLITHHRLTMARVHRLYGLTMRERGVSRIVSVDMQAEQNVSLFEKTGDPASARQAV